MEEYSILHAMTVQQNSWHSNHSCHRGYISRRAALIIARLSIGADETSRRYSLQAEHSETSCVLALPSRTLDQDTSRRSQESSSLSHNSLDVIEIPLNSSFVPSSLPLGFCCHVHSRHLRHSHRSGLPPSPAMDTLRPDSPFGSAIPAASDFRRTAVPGHAIRWCGQYVSPLGHRSAA